VHDDLATIWPPSALRVQSGNLALVYPDDGLLVALGRLAGDGVHDDDQMPFYVPWTRGTPLQVARTLLTYQWRARAEMTPESWRLELAVLHRGEPVGIQSVSADRFMTTRVAETGSWLGRSHQGQGIGTSMRVLVLHLLFEGLGAAAATSAAFDDNGPSNAVSRSLGYRPNGVDTAARESRPARLLRYRLDREEWLTRPASQRPMVTYAGIDDLRAFLGLDRGPQ
jgi:RimJ/RimL family protein N-acetyltransferase